MEDSFTFVLECSQVGMNGILIKCHGLAIHFPVYIPPQVVNVQNAQYNASKVNSNTKHNPKYDASRIRVTQT